MKTAIVFLADGMEECEALVTVDMLRRAGINVITASIMKRHEVTSSHNITVIADALAEDVDYSAADAVILPGGMPGTTNLNNCELVKQQCVSFAAGRYVAAICAAPMVLGGLGLLKGRKATCYPGFDKYLEGAEYTGESAVTDGNIITGKGMGAAIPFSMAIITALIDAETAADIAASVMYE
ncbi:MAG: DJ-1/PfpI family protein [Parasporobacterium sp.]|nr:DJ-1/PfpI family protein [Parasporobacterium sp.]